MMNYFSSLSFRERALIVGAAGLLGILLIWQFILAPVFSARAEALLSEQRALRDYVIVRDGVGALGQRRSGGENASRESFNRAAIINTARGENLPITRLQVQSDEGIKVWFENAASPTLYSFLQQVTTQYRAQISRAQLSRNQDGSVSAQITFTGLPS